MICLQEWNYKHGNLLITSNHIKVISFIICNAIKIWLFYKYLPLEFCIIVIMCTYICICVYLEHFIKFDRGHQYIFQDGYFWIIQNCGFGFGMIWSIWLFLNNTKLWIQVWLIWSIASSCKNCKKQKRQVSKKESRKRQKKSAIGIYFYILSSRQKKRVYILSKKKRH